MNHGDDHGHRNAITFPTSPDPQPGPDGNIAVEIGYATGLHEDALFATAVVLLVFHCHPQQLAVVRSEEESMLRLTLTPRKNWRRP